MPLTEAQRDRVMMELTRVAPQLARAAPVERGRLVRIALEQAGILLTWEEWDAQAPELLGDMLAGRWDETGV